MTARSDALREAAKVAAAVEVVEAERGTYYAQLGDASATQGAIVAAIESLAAEAEKESGERDAVLTDLIRWAERREFECSLGRPDESARFREAAKAFAALTAPAKGKEVTEAMVERAAKAIHESPLVERQKSYLQWMGLARRVLEATLTGRSDG